MNVIWSTHVSWATIRIKGTGLWINKLTDGSNIECTLTQSKGIKATLYVKKISDLYSIFVSQLLQLVKIDDRWANAALTKFSIAKLILAPGMFFTTNNKAWWHINLVSYNNYNGLPPQFCPLIFNNLERNFQKSDRHGIIGAVKQSLQPPIFSSEILSKIWVNSCISE